MNCILRVQADPEIKGEVTSPSWENREKFAASREKCFLTEDTPQKHGYIISSYDFFNMAAMVASLDFLRKWFYIFIYKLPITPYQVSSQFALRFRRRNSKQIFLFLALVAILFIRAEPFC